MTTHGIHCYSGSPENAPPVPNLTQDAKGILPEMGTAGDQVDQWIFIFLTICLFQMYLAESLRSAPTLLHFCTGNIFIF